MSSYRRKDGSKYSKSLIQFRHQPCEKYRIVCVLSEPFNLSTKEGLRAWKNHYDAVVDLVVGELGGSALFAFALALVTQRFMMLQATAILLANDMSAAPLWKEFRFFQESLIMIYGLAVHALWYAPIYGWLLLVSGWARRTALLWAVLPFVAIAGVERILFGSDWPVCTLAAAYGDVLAAAPHHVLDPPDQANAAVRILHDDVAGRDHDHRVLRPRGMVPDARTGLVSADDRDDPCIHTLGKYSVWLRPLVVEATAGYCAGGSWSCVSCESRPGRTVG